MIICVKDYSLLLWFYFFKNNLNTRKQFSTHTNKWTGCQLERINNIYSLQVPVLLFLLQPNSKNKMYFYTYLQIVFFIIIIGNIPQVIIYLFIYVQPINHLVYHMPTYGQGRRWDVDLIWVKTSVDFYWLCPLSSAENEG